MSLPVCLGLFSILFTPLALCSLVHHYPERHFSLLNKLSEPIPTNYSSYRLPKTVTPSSYDLTLFPFLNNNTFRGSVVITLDIHNETDLIILNLASSKYIQPLKASLVSPNSNVSLSKWWTYEFYELIIFNLTDRLAVQNNVSLTISFEGTLTYDMLGFYVSTYNTTTANNSMAITQFESTYARRAFPCFDEPAFRAQFTIKIFRSESQNSMSNMQLKSHALDNDTGLIVDTYYTSPAMPTYLVAFGVSEMPYSDPPGDNGTFRVYARPAVLQDTAYLVSVGPDILNKIGNFVQIAYPLKKMDVVAVPDFDAGAMENWGLTTYREKYVLYNPQKNSWRDKYMVLSVVAHEFGHQWFGDLVTPAWWDYSWLNEAFATYFEYTTSNQVQPDWNVGSTMFVASAVQVALASDVGRPRPMTAPVSTPSQIESVFDYVIYEKGGSVLRMIEYFLGTAVWKAGLNQYLSQNSLGTGTPNELFSALQQFAVNLNNVQETLLGWTTQPGYPLVTVSAMSANTYNVTQAPYDLDAEFSNLTWNIPLTFTSQSQPVFDPSLAPSHWLYPSTPNSSLVHVNDSGWVIFNVDQVGFYRVNYDQSNWNKLKSQLDSNFSVIGAINRAQLIDDAFHLARTGHIDYATAFGLTSYLPAETDFAPWNAFFTNMRFLINQFYNTSTGEQLKQYARSIIHGPFAKLTADLTKSISTFSGSLSVQAAGQFACDVGHSDCENLAYYEFQKLQANSSYLILPEVKQTVMCVGLRKDTTKSAFMSVLDYYLNSDNGAEKLTVMYAMGCVTDPESITVYLDVASDADANHIRLQDRWIAVSSVMSHQTGLTVGLQYLADNFDRVSNALGSDFASVISTLASTISQQDHIIQVHNIVNNAKVPLTLRTMLNSTVLPAVARRQAWAASQSASGLKSWLSSYFSSASSTVVNVFLIVVASAIVTLY